jgi:hypothetical protein
VIIQVIDKLNVLPNKAKDQTPIAANRYRQEPSAISGKFMQLPSRHIYILCLRGTIERGQLNSQPGRMMRLNTGFAALFEERFETFVLE